MAMTPEVLINRARDLHPLFDRDHHLDGTLLRALVAEERRLVGKALLVNPSCVVASLTITLASYSFASGQALPAFHHVEAAEATPTDPECRAFPLPEVNWADRLRPPSGRLSYSVHGSRVFLSGTAEDWDRVTSVVVTYAPIPVDLASLDDEMILPDTAESALEAFLAYFMARRTPAGEMAPAELAAFREESLRAEADFLAEMGSAYVARSFRVRAVY